MASLVPNNGLQRIGVQASQATGTGVTYSASRQLQTMAWDDLNVAFAATNTKLNDGGSVTNEYDQAFDATPTRAGQVISHISTIPTGQGNFTIRRASIHDDTAANVSSSSTTLCVGIDGQSLTKTSDFTLKTQIDLTYSSV